MNNSNENNKLFWNIVTSIIFAAVVIFLFAFPIARAEDCSKLEWTKTSSRTQGNGWIWFPGKATSEIRSTSVVSAEGEALSYEAGECGVIHTRTKFHEKCTQKNSDGTFTTFVRASIKAKYCSEAMSFVGTEKIGKISHPILTGRLNSYKMSNAESRVKPSCNKNQIFNCSIEHHAAKDSGDLFLAAAYGKRGCLYGRTALCTATAAVLVQARMLKQALAWANHGCIQGDRVNCRMRDRINKVITAYTNSGIAMQ